MVMQEPIWGMTEVSIIVYSLSVSHKCVGWFHSKKVALIRHSRRDDRAEACQAWNSDKFVGFKQHSAKK